MGVCLELIASREPQAATLFAVGVNVAEAGAIAVGAVVDKVFIK